jgi:hypothetical protein
MDTKELANRINHCIDELIKLRIEATGGSVVPARAYERAARDLCIVDGEPIEGRVIRGCCEKHHKQFARMIKDGTHTELELMRIGWLLPASPGGRSSKDDEVSKEISSSLVAEITEQYSEQIEAETPIIQPVGKRKSAPPQKRSTTTKRKTGS